MPNVFQCRGFVVAARQPRLTARSHRAASDDGGGPEESPRTAVAILQDRLRIAGARKQIYATQLVRAAHGKLEPAPLEDPMHVDLRREAAGLPPLAQAICAAK